MNDSSLSKGTLPDCVLQAGSKEVGWIYESFDFTALPYRRLVKQPRIFGLPQPDTGFGSFVNL